MKKHRQAPPPRTAPARTKLREQDIRRLLDMIQKQDPACVAEAARLSDLHPDASVLWELRSAACFSVQDYEGSVAANERALALDPRSGVAMGNKATALAMLKRPEEAAAAARAALDLPGVNRQGAYNTLGGSARELGNLEEAIEHYRAALATNTGIAVPLRNLGTLMVDTGRFEAAEQVFEIVMQVNQQDVLAREGLGMAKVGRAATAADPDAALALGWDNYAARWSAFPPDMFRRFWAGDPLGRRTLYVYRDQGVGDEIYWSSCLPDLAQEARADGGRVIVHVDPRLVPLFRRSFPDLTIGTGPHGGMQISAGGQVGAGFLADVAAADGPFDMILPMPALPFIYRRRFADFRPQAYLKADPDRVAHWRAWLDALGPERKVGVTWRSFYSTRMRDRYHFGPQDLAPLAAIPGVRLVSLDYTGAEIPAGLDIAVPPFDQRHELDEAAALITALDAVVGHGGTPSVMAGALGQFSILLTPNPEWLQLGMSDRLPWFADAHVLVRTADALDRVVTLLRSRFSIA